MDHHEAQYEADSAAITALAGILADNDWYEILVDDEECSVIEKIFRSDGTEVILDDELRDDLLDQTFAVMGNCPRSAFPSRKGHCRTTIDELVAMLEIN